MTRTEAREQAFILVFEKCFSALEIDEIIEAAKEARNFEIDSDGYILSAFRGVYNSLEEIDSIIKENLSGWKIERISKVSLAILRLAVYEIKYLDSIPTGASINEAVELAKKYSIDSDAAFINGVLGTIARKPVI